LLAEQNTSGWNRILEGWISKQWQVVQQCYFTSIGSHHT
jgi:hypothetical protein